MSGTSVKPTFRLLDWRVGWTDVYLDKKNKVWVLIPDPTPTSLTPMSTDPAAPPPTPGTDPGGAQLLGVGVGPDGAQLLGVGAGQSSVDAATLLAALPPARLGRGCEPGSWLLLGSNGWVLRRDPGTGYWHSVWCSEHVPDGLDGAVALAASPERFATAGAEGVQVWTIAGEARVAEIRLKGAQRVAFFPGGEVLVAAQSGTDPMVLHRFGPAGDRRGQVTPDGVSGPIDRLAVDANETIWIATSAGSSFWALWSGTWPGPFTAASATALTGAFPPTGLTRCADAGFCLQEMGADGVAVTQCYSWNGCPVPESCVPALPAPQWQKDGWIGSGWIDSGLPRCRWHRIRVDADVPPGTAVEIWYVATDFDPTPLATVPWEPPAWDDWRSGPAGALDILTQSAVGRFFRLQLNLTGDGANTPVVRSVRIDFPRRTSLDRLPAVYRASPEAEDFTERFLANFDASLEDLDAAIARFPAMFSVAGVPPEVLPWLGSFLDVAFDPTWSDARRRAILSQLPALYPLRGTVCGFVKIFNLIFDLTPAIEELAPARPWGALADSGTPADPSAQPNAQLDAVRLFGQGRARFRLGSSALGQAPIHAYGDPDLDPLVAEAYRFEVQIPRGTGGAVRDRMTALIEAQKPAHTVATIRFGGDGFVVGVWSAVGIDTAFLPLPQPVLGATGNVQLNRASTAAAGPPRGRLPLTVGASSAVGVRTLLE